jgi:hypothetical protein
MLAARPTALFVSLLFGGGVLAAGPVRAQTGDSAADQFKASLIQVLSLATFGTVSIREPDASVVRDGSDFRVRLPLSGFAAPPDAAITAVARPLENGRMDIASLMFPSSGTIERPPANGMPSRITFAIGEQTISAKIDPTLATESTYTADMGGVGVEADQGDQHSEQHFAHIVTDGSVSAEPDGRLTFGSQSRIMGFRLIGHTADGVRSDVSARAAAGHIAVEGMDRAQGMRMLAALRDFATGAAAERAEHGPDQPAFDPSPEQRERLRAMVDDAVGLLNRLEIDETMEDVHFSVGKEAGGGPTSGATSGTIGQVRLTVSGDAVQERLNGRFGVVLDGIVAAGASPDAAGMIPHHVDLKTVLSGVQVGPLIALLRAATQGHADPTLLQAQAMALLGQPGAQVGIEALSFDSGPLTVTATARLVPLGNGQPGGEIHLAARGMDALMAQAASQPNLQRLMPLVFMAKGMGRPVGDSLVWDISLGDGPIRINGVPFGQALGKTR